MKNDPAFGCGIIERSRSGSDSASCALVSLFLQVYVSEIHFGPKISSARRDEKRPHA